MAGEKKGKAYEAIVWIALSQLQSQKKVKGQVFWNQKPSGMSIEPDFTLGSDPDNPSIVILVTHSGSAKDSEKKFWRNIGELTEAKILLPSVPQVYSIAFDSVIKDDLKKIQAKAFDGQLIVGELNYGVQLLRWIEANYRKLPKGDGSKAQTILEMMDDRSNGTELRNLLNRLTDDIKNLVTRHRAELSNLWKLERTRRRGVSPERKITYMRRGIGKYLLLQPPYSTAIARDGRLRADTPEQVLRALEKIGLIKRAIGGVRVSDPEMLWVASNLKPALVEKICQAQPLRQMSELIESLLSLGDIEAQVEYISKYWNKLTTASGLYQHLKDCHSNPTAVSARKSSSKSQRVWLYHDLIEWIKLSGKARTSYGLARLMADIQEAASDRQHQRDVADVIKSVVEWRSTETIRLGLQDWHSTASKQCFPLYDDDLARVSTVLARRLSECSQPDPVKDTEKIMNAIVQTSLEAKLLTYRHFQPIESALTIALEEFGFSIRKLTYTKACFAQLAEADNTRLDPRSAGTSIVVVKHTLINWQSAHGSHTGDKTKELCGRAVALRYSWDCEAKTFVARNGISKLILIVDGTWRQIELDALVQSGWDEIYYPDEMDKVVATIE